MVYSVQSALDRTNGDRNQWNDSLLRSSTVMTAADTNGDSHSVRGHNQHSDPLHRVHIDTKNPAMSPWKRSVLFVGIRWAHYNISESLPSIPRNYQMHRYRVDCKYQIPSNEYWVDEMSHRFPRCIPISFCWTISVFWCWVSVSHRMAVWLCFLVKDAFSVSTWSESMSVFTAINQENTVSIWCSKSIETEILCNGLNL